MIKLFGDAYYIDIDQFDEYVALPSVSGGTELSISAVKFEVIKAMIEVILSGEEQIDETLGLKGQSISIPFKLAFNTLIKHKILNKI
jgi:hypothetical protein